MHVRASAGEIYGQLNGLGHGLALHSVCEETLFSNIGECWSASTATIMILGDTCTRACRFCAVRTGNPRGIVDTEEPAHVADAIIELMLNYIVITSVDRDDLPDGSAEIFAEKVRQIKKKSPKTLVAMLTPDFRGVMVIVRTVVESRLDLFGQNIETGCRISFILATNNSNRSPQEYVDKLAHMDAAVSPAEILVSGQATARFLAREYPGGTRVHVFGMPAFKQAMNDVGFILANSDVELVVASMDRQVTFEEFKLATLLIHRGARFIATNLDPTNPSG
jgi:hypothetical protein